MKDSQQLKGRFLELLSISRRIMKDSQRTGEVNIPTGKYIKANNERFSTQCR